MCTQKAYVTVQIPLQLKEDIMKAVHEGHFMNQSDLIRQGIRLILGSTPNEPYYPGGKRTSHD